MEEKKDKTAKDAKDELFRSTKNDLRDFKSEFWSQMSALKGEQYDVSEEQVFKEAAAPVDEVTVEPPAAGDTSVSVAEPLFEEATVTVEQASVPDEQLSVIGGQTEALTEGLKKDYDALFDFLDTVDRARFGYYDSYLKLGEVAKSGSSFSEFAKRNITALNAVLYSDYAFTPSILSSTAVITDKETVNLDKASANRLFDIINRYDIPHDTRRFSASIAGDKPKKDILDGALGILNASNSLYALAATCGILREKFGRKAEFMDIVAWKKFCAEELKKPVMKNKGDK